MQPTSPPSPNHLNAPSDRIRIGLGIALLAALTGCVGYVDGGYGGPVVVSEPDVIFFGGSYERGRDVRDYSHRGVESRAVVHHEVRQPPVRPPAGRGPSHPPAFTVAPGSGRAR